MSDSGALRCAGELMKEAPLGDRIMCMIQECDCIIALLRHRFKQTNTVKEILVEVYVANSPHKGDSNCLFLMPVFDRIETIDSIASSFVEL